MINGSFIKLMRSKNALELMKRPKSFMLLAQIAQRARRTSELNIDGLAVGEALIGDHESIGLTEQEYRTAKNHLARLGLATFEGTSRGTVARLIDDTIFDINRDADNDRDNERPTVRQRSANDRATTNKKENKEKNEKNEKKLKDYAFFKESFLKKTAMPQPTYEDLLKARR